MPAAAVIPAPIVYCKVVVIKTLVVEFKQGEHVLVSNQDWIENASLKLILTRL